MECKGTGSPSATAPSGQDDGWSTTEGGGAGTAAAVLALGVVNAVIGGLLLARLRPGAASIGTSGAEAPLEVAVGAAVAALGVAIMAWWVLSLVVTMAVELRGRRAGRAPALSSALSPAFMRRLVGALLSLHLVAGTAGTAVAAPVAPMAVAMAPLDAVASGFVLVHPTTSGGTGHARSTEPSPGADPWFVPRAPALEDGAPLVRPPTRDAGAGATTPTGTSSDRTATVVAGDSLWSLTARQLGPLATDVEIARQWPRWYDLNRDVIGPDPAVIRPGQVLRVPTVAADHLDGVER
ncbi:LysM domain-containing protein [Tersicoccus sp. MR15.9]|uniref:LysM peptidoglycan-binding domain-containing protein n=1 Tax=Tersicoccus mangrovi TaxID=3121635 RepID=UPI002FE60B5F